MTVTEFFAGNSGNPFVPGADDSLLEPMPIPPKPIVRTPRSAPREYSASELRTAARMMDLLRRGDDHRTLAQRNPDAVMDVVVDRLLKVLR